MFSLFFLLFQLLSCIILQRLLIAKRLEIRGLQRTHACTKHNCIPLRSLRINAGLRSMPHWQPSSKGEVRTVIAMNARAFSLQQLFQMREEIKEERGNSSPLVQLDEARQADIQTDWQDKLLKNTSYFYPHSDSSQTRPIFVRIQLLNTTCRHFFMKPKLFGYGRQKE